MSEINRRDLLKLGAGAALAIGAGATSIPLIKRLAGGAPPAIDIHKLIAGKLDCTEHFTTAFGTPHRLNRRSICSSNRRAPLMSFYGRDFDW